MVDRVQKPGVRIEQVFTATPPTPVQPQLVPCVVGPGYEVLDILNADGTLNSNALQASAYTQAARTITQSSFPAPRGNGDELNFLEDEINVSLRYGNSTKNLVRDPGQAYLRSHNVAHRAAIRIDDATVVAAGYANLNGLTLVLGIDNPVPTDVTDDVTVTFSTPADMDAVVTQINDAVGYDVAYKLDDGGDLYLLLVSPTYGASSSITVRGSSTAYATLFAAALAAPNQNIRTVGSGFRAKDDGDGDTTSALLELGRGEQYRSDATTYTMVALAGLADGVENLLVFDTWDPTDANALDMTNAAYTDHTSATQVAAINFTTSWQVATPSRNGDVVYLDGVAPQGAQLIDASASDFRLGVVDSVNSTYDSEGNPLSQIYIPVEHSLSFAPTMYAPRYCWVLARALSGTTSNTSASSTSAGTYTSATAAIATGAGVGVPPALGQTTVFQITRDGVVGPEETLVWTSLYASIADAAAAFAGLAAAQGIEGVTMSEAGGTVSFTSTRTGGDQVVTVKAGGTGNANLNFSAVADTTATGADNKIAGLSGDTLEFYLDDNPYLFSFTFTSTSVDEMKEIVDAAVGAEVVTLNTAPNTVTISSSLSGVGSNVVMVSNLSASLAFGATTPGTGRPDPNFSVDSATGSVALGGQIFRDQLTGIPIDSSVVAASVYIGYRALRLDITADAATPGLIEVSNFTDLSSDYGPISTQNPLGLALFYALSLAGEGVVVKGLGVSDVSASEPDGTMLAYADAIDLIAAEEVYHIVPLTQAEEVIGLFDTHVTSLSSADNRKERFLISSPVNPTRYPDTVVTSGSDAENTAALGQLNINVSPAADLAALGIDPNNPIPFPMSDDTELYVEFTSGGVLKRFAVSSVSGSVLTLRASVPSGSNLDGFYTEEVFSDSLDEADFSLQVRGAPLTLPGSTKIDSSAYAGSIRDISQEYANRRHMRLTPDEVGATIGGVDSRIPSYYFGAALAGAAAGLLPQTPFSNRAVSGFNAIYGPKLTESQLDIVSAGNAVIQQNAAGGPLSLRMQGTTDPSSIESREWSIVRAVDAFAKLLRSVLINYVGPFNITREYLDEVSTAIAGVNSLATDTGLVRSASLNSLEQDEDAPDTLLVNLTLEVAYPANYINVTIVV